MLEGKNAVCEKGDGCYYISSSLTAEDDIFKNGYCTVQGRSSMMSAELLSPEKGESVLDICAAPGGKTCYMAQLMNNSGKIVSCDIHGHRTELISKNAKRLGVTIAEPCVSDGTEYNESFADFFDKVLADVPCSGLGVISQKPDIKYSKQSFDSLTDLQYNILYNAGRYVKKGGYIVYSTCTLNKAENEGVVERFLLSCKNFEKDSECITVFPDEKHNGFFMCRLKRCE
jgi:16S rRNA (cytosine967-C5)-methyltransferase